MREIVAPGRYVAMPDSAPERDIPWVMACHGSGREALSYRDVPFYRRQRDIALAEGCVFASCSMGADTYGTERGLSMLEAFYDQVRTCLPVRKKTALWGSSAGGCVMLRFAMAHPERVALLLGTFPVIDPRSVFHLESMRSAWGNLSDAALLEKIASWNPIEHGACWPDVPIVIAHGRRDRAVPVEKNALALEKLLGERVRLFITNDEHSTSAFGLYDTPLYAQALAQMVKTTQ